MSHNKIILVIDVTSLLRLWSCRISHNISATRTQPYGTDGQTDRLTNTIALHGLEEPAHASRGLEEPFFQLCCCVGFWFWREIGFGCTYYYVLGVPLVFLVLAGNSFCRYVRT
jgi:hypothetical protein